MPWVEILSVVLFLAAGVGTAVVRSRRTARILDLDPASRKDRERRVPSEIVAILDAPDVAARLLASKAAHPPVTPLLRDAKLDLPALLDDLRADFERQARGEPLEHLTRSASVEQSLTRRPLATSVLATAEPELHGAFVDERWLTTRVNFQALTESAGTAKTSHWQESWSLRRAWDQPRWELLQVLSCETRTAQPPDAIGATTARLAAWSPTGNAPVSREILDAMLEAVLDALSGRPFAEGVLAPILCADLRFRAASQAGPGGGFYDLRGSLAEFRPGTVRREGALEVATVVVDGTIEGAPPWHFRETWSLVRRAGGSDADWRLWRADPLR